MPATPYTTVARLTAAVGADALAAITPDAAAVDAAVEAANSRVDGKVQILHTIPVPADQIPEWLSLAATRIAHYELCVDDAALTDIIKARYTDAVAQINDVGLGRTKLFIDTTDEEAPEGATRTEAGKAHFTPTGDRRFTRGGTGGIL